MAVTRGEGAGEGAGVERDSGARRDRKLFAEIDEISAAIECLGAVKDGRRAGARSIAIARDLSAGRVVRTGSAIADGIREGSGGGRNRARARELKRFHRRFSPRPDALSFKLNSFAEAVLIGSVPTSHPDHRRRITSTVDYAFYAFREGDEK